MNRPTEVEPTHVAHSGHSTVQPYTPAMMAQMLGISVRAIRSWYRAGLLEPSRVVMKIPYFDYTEMAKAKTFAQWMRQGLTAQVIVRQLTALNRLRSGVAEPAACLPIRLEGKRLVLRQGGLQVEASGQIQFGFEVDGDAEISEPVTIKFSPTTTPAADDDHSLAAMLEAALEAEDNDDLDTATQWYRSILGRYGPDADICFQLAELLYRQADLSGARERYFMAIELEPGLVEARANLGCVLAECGQLQWAVAAFEGALQQYPEYADAHFHLARTLDELGQQAAAVQHWQSFLELAPASPWADEALARLADQPALELQ